MVGLRFRLYIRPRCDFLKKSLEIPHNLTVDEPPLVLTVSNNGADASIKLHDSDIFNNIVLLTNHKHLSDHGIDTGAIFTCGGLSFALIWTKKSIFLFDSHFRASDCNQVANVKVILMKFASTKDVDSFITTFYKSIIGDTRALHNLYVDIDILDKNCYPSLHPAKKLTNKAIATNSDFVKTGLIQDKYKSGKTFRSKKAVPKT